MQRELLGLGGDGAQGDEAPSRRRRVDMPHLLLPAAFGRGGQRSLSTCLLFPLSGVFQLFPLNSPLELLGLVTLREMNTDTKVQRELLGLGGDGAQGDEACQT